MAMQIQNNIPVMLSDFKVDDQNPVYSRAKLKAFAIGETQDGRVFSEEFAEELVKTLPYAPVVGYYNEEGNDFYGHNYLQYVYGVVPGDALIDYIEEEDGKYITTDILLYTGRPDTTGFIAKQIVGKRQSIELDPESLELSIEVKDGKSKMFFKHGRIIGLSVLGDNEWPAFANSEFFSVKNEERTEFNESTQLRKDLIEYLNAQSFAQYKEQVEQVLAAARIGGKIVELTEKTVTIDSGEVFNIQSVGSVPLAVQPTSPANDTPSLEVDPVEDNEEEKVVVEEGEEKEEVEEEEGEVAEQEPEKEEEVAKAEKVDGPEEEPEEDPEDADEPQEDGEDEDKEEAEEPVDGEEADPDDERITVQEENDGKAKEEVGEEPQGMTANYSATLSDSERAELTEFRRQAKFRVIDTFRGKLNETDIKSFVADIDSLEIVELEKEMALAFWKQHNVEVPEQKTAPSTYAMIPSLQTSGEKRMTEDDVIAKYL